MSDKISQNIDNYTIANIKRLRCEEGKTGRKFTKYDIAQLMVSEGKLSKSDFARWMNTSEGYESSVLTSQQKQALKQGSVWAFNSGMASFGAEPYLDKFDGDEYIKDPVTGANTGIRKNPKPVKTFVPKWAQEDIVIREQTIDILLNNAQTALSMIESYHAGIGYISADAFVQGMNVLGDVSWDLLTGRQDFVTVFEQEKGLAHEIETLKKLKSKTKAPVEFAKEFKKLYGVEFKPENFKRLSEVSQQLNELNAYSGLDKYFAFGIEKLKDADMNSLDPAAYLAPVFGNNPLKAQEYINELKSECKNDEELREKLISILMESKKETESKLALLEHNRSRLESEFKSAYKSAMGDYKSDEIVEEYINIQRMNAMGTKVAGTIALSFFAMGSSTVMKMGSKVISKLGVRAGNQVVKAGKTGTMAAVSAAETIVGGLTSRSGMSLERGEQALEEFKNGLMFGAFGTFVSGPFGNVISKVLSKNPKIFSQLVASQKFSLGAGAVAETSADVLFDRLVTDLSFKESLAQNGIMNFGMMFVGARMSKAAKLPDISEVKIEKMKDGTYNLKANGKVFYKAKNADELAVATLILGGKSKVENSEKEIIIPPARCRAPRPGFDESLDAYVNIIRNNTQEIAEICSKYQRDIYDEEQFANAYAKFLSEKMHMPYYPELKAITSNDIAGGMQNTTNILYYNLSKMKRMSDLMQTITHEMHHFLQQKEIFSTISIEEYSAMKAKADILCIVKENPSYYKSEQEIANAIAEQTRGYIQNFENAGWRQVLEMYPKNTNPNSPYTIRAKALLEADMDYDNDYYSNLLEREAYEIGTKTQIEIEYSVFHTIDWQERNIILEIYDTLNSPTFKNVSEAQEVLHTFESNPYNMIEIVKEAKNRGLADANSIIENII